MTFSTKAIYNVIELRYMPKATEGRRRPKSSDPARVHKAQTQIEMGIQFTLAAFEMAEEPGSAVAMIVKSDNLEA